MEEAIFGAGCFWCVEAVFSEVKGVESVQSGYMGGQLDNPTYKEVCSGTTGHAEVAKISFNPSDVSYEQLLEIFWRTHNPTTLNRQGNDVGTQYRSVIFYTSEDQKQKALASKQAVEHSKLWENPIVTEISAATKFYAAEDYHNDYYKLNPDQPYCTYVVGPKVAKFKHAFAELLK